MDRSAVAAKAGVALIPCEYNNNNIITVGLVPGARRKRNLNIRFTRNTHTHTQPPTLQWSSLFCCLQEKRFILAGHHRVADVIFITPPNGYQVSRVRPQWPDVPQLNAYTYYAADPVIDSYIRYSGFAHSVRVS